MRDQPDEIKERCENQLLHSKPTAVKFYFKDRQNDKVQM